MMKHWLAGLLGVLGLYAQNVGIGTATPSPSAILELYSTNQGVLIPRLSTAQRDAIASPAHGLLIFNTDNFCLEAYNVDSAKWFTIACRLNNGCIPTPLAPIAQNATGITVTSFQAQWSSVAGATHYYLDVATDPSFNNYVPGYLNRDVGSTTTFTVTGLQCNTTYYYRVRSANNCGVSISSNTVSVTTAPCPTKIYVIGGYESPPYVYHDANEVYIPVFDGWQTKQGLLFATLGAAAGYVNGKIYYIGGYPHLRKVQVYDPITDTWTTQNDAPVDVDIAGFGVINGKIYIAAGWDQVLGAVRRTLVYDPVTDTWDTTLSQIPTPRWGVASAVYNNKLYVIGGYDGNNYLNHVEVYDPISDTWASKAPMPDAVSYACAAVVGDTIFVAGGSGTGTPPQRNLLRAYVPTSNTWFYRPNMPTARWGCACAAVNDTLYVIGGVYHQGGSSYPRLRTNEAYYQGQWSTKSYMPTQRSHCVAVVAD